MNVILTTIALLLLPRWSFGEDGLRLSSNGVAIASIGGVRTINEMAFYPPRGIPDRPLLVTAHGHGGSGPDEVNQWLSLAKAHNFTIVCPTFLSSSSAIYLPVDQAYFKNCLLWIEDHLQYDKANVYMTGMSGGGCPCWYLATKHPDFFRGLFFQSCNFDGDFFGLDLKPWRDKPIKLIWGSKDLADISIENNQAITALRAADCKHYVSEIIQGAGHEEHPNLVVRWIEEIAKQKP